MKSWYFTFGVGQGDLAHKYVVIKDDDYEKARAKMFEAFGNNWSFDYSEEEWFFKRGTRQWNQMVRYGAIPQDAPYDSISQVELFHLTEITLDSK